MFGFLHTKKAKRITNATVAGLFVAVQLPLALLWSPTAFAANDKVNDNKPVTGSLTINESAPTDTAQKFDFTYSGDPSSFSLKDSQSKALNNLTVDQSYSVSQAVVDGWDTPTITCDNATVSGSTVTFAPTADTPDATCTYTNTPDLVEVITDTNNENTGNNGQENQGNNGQSNENNGDTDNQNNGNNGQNNQVNIVQSTENNANNSISNPDSDKTCPTGTGLSQQGNNCKITICHRDSAVKKPYVVETVDQDSADGDAGNDNGQGDHYIEHDEPVFNSTMQQGDSWGDIIPPIPGVHDGLNWSVEGQAIWNNDCKPVGGQGGDETGSISGAKFNDLNGNGTWDQNEPGLSGWTIFLDANSNGMLDNGEESMTTATDGTYSFTDLEEGTYKVCEVQKTGWTQKKGGTENGCYSLTVSAEGTLNWEDIDFGNMQLGGLGQVLGESTTAGELVNTGSPLLVNLFAGLAIFGSVAALSVANRRKTVA